MLKVQGLTKVFGGLKAVDNASVEVGEGRIVALIGPNGAGKTTLFACIAGFLPVNAVPPDASLGLGFARAPAGEILYGQTGFANLGFT